MKISIYPSAGDSAVPGCLHFTTFLWETDAHRLGKISGAIFDRFICQRFSNCSRLAYVSFARVGPSRD